MTRPLSVTLFALTLLASPALAQGRRQAVVVGANTGWAMDQPLRYAVEDSHRVADVLITLGDFAPADVTVLEDPSTAQVVAALEASARAKPDLFVFYYSGHADARRLHLGGPALELEDLWNRLKAHPAQVKVGLFDACQAGSLLAAKGGRAIKPFEVKVDDALQLQGTAVLASSGADELSQEARVLRGSFFTHHLVSGLRGAADTNGDGRVSLSEAYLFAATRTTLDTADTHAGAQRPVFRYELKGRGDVVMTTLFHSGTALDFAADTGRCYVTDDAERRLVAEVPGGESTRVLVPPGAYVVKCPRDDGYRVAALTAAAGAAVAVKGLPFREFPLSTGVLKGSGSPEATDDFKRDGFRALREGRADAAMAAFNAALSKDLRDAAAFRGKAQAYLALAAEADQRGAVADAQRLRSAAVRTDPRLADDPEYRALLPAAPPPAPPQDFTERNVQAANPREYQRIGLGITLTGPEGPLALSFDVVMTEWLQMALHFSPLVLGVSASVRVMPLSGNWSPYIGAGGTVTLAGLGVVNGPQLEITAGDFVLARRNAFDRVGYLEGGVQFASRHWQAELGLGLGVSAPIDAPLFLGVYPALTVRYFF